MTELKNRVQNLLEQINRLTQTLNLPQTKQKILEIEEQMQSPEFWKDRQAAEKISQEYSVQKNFLEFWENLTESYETLLSRLEIQTASDLELTKQIENLEKQFHEHRIQALLHGKYDNHDAVFALHAGAGGTDAQDWTEILLRMLLRYAERKHLKAEILEKHSGSEAGIKSVTVQVSGPFAYGLLKSEAGVHRLVRQSPFNPAHTRETSFALVEVLPVLESNEEISIDPKDLQIEANTASGHGGQSVNTTYSAVRITHLPTGIKVSIQNERSQHQNKELAMKILQAKLKALEETKLEKEKKELRGEFKSAEWGNQIRSYVLHPYKLVKDHRTQLEITDPASVLDGNIDDFVEKYLEDTIKK